MPKNKTVLLVANGDLRLSANQNCWAKQEAMEAELGTVLKSLGGDLKRAHKYDPELKHGFISNQRQGMDIFAKIDRKAPLIIAEAVWQYSHHLLHGLMSHEGPILTVANWSGTWPGLVGMLNLNGSLTKAGVAYSTLWSEDFSYRQALSEKAGKKWLETGSVTHPTSHVKKYKSKGRQRSEKKARQIARRSRPQQSHHGRLRRVLHGHV